MGPNDTNILTVFTSSQALSAAEARGVVGWWTAERQPGESLLAFLVRREVLAPTTNETAEALEDGATPLVAERLFADRGIERLRQNLGLSPRRAEQPDLVNCLARPCRRSGISANRRKPHPMRTVRQPAPSVRAGTLLGKYLLTEQIGRGASSIVFRALHRALNLVVAIKVQSFEADADDPVVREQFRAEARLQAQLDHPNIVRVLDFEDEAAMPYLVLEYVDGVNLADQIARSGRLSPELALKTVLQIGEALEAVHQLGVVHRDVKPGNILLPADGRPAKLADLGLALAVNRGRVPRAAGTPRGTLAGTAGYMAPEQALSSPSIDHRADIYALGATLYHALTGRLPFTGRSRVEVMFKHGQEPLLLPDQVVPELGPAVSAVVGKMMAKDPAARYQTYGELLPDLARLVRRPPSAPCPSADSALVEPATTGTITDSRRALSPSAWRKLFPLRPAPVGTPAG